MKCGLVQNLEGVATPGRNPPRMKGIPFLELVWIKVVFCWYLPITVCQKDIIDVLDDSDVEVLHVRICKKNYVQSKYPNMYVYALYCVYTHGNDSSGVKQHNQYMPSISTLSIQSSKGCDPNVSRMTSIRWGHQLFSCQTSLCGKENPFHTKPAPFKVFHSNLSGLIYMVVPGIYMIHLWRRCLEPPSIWIPKDPEQIRGKQRIADPIYRFHMY